jgi:Fe-S-cluster containining protein
MPATVNGKAALLDQLGQMCRECGACCMCIESAPVTFDDLARLAKGLGLSYQEVSDGMLFHEENSIYIDQMRGCCKALSRDERSGQYTCHVYEHRPEVCRTFECHVYFDARQWATLVETPAVNLFHDCQTVEEVLQEFRRHFPSLRSLQANLGEEFEEPMKSNLVQIAGAKAFPRLFPSAKL